MRYLIIFLFLLFSCKESIDNSSKDSILKILSENQKIQEQLVSKSDFIPDLSSLKNAVKEAKVISEKNKNLQAELEKLESILLNINTTEQEAFFESVSSFSEQLSDILKANQIKSEYNKFYCPMVSKYWVAKGQEIHNPYAPEMRDCGELVK